MPSKEVHFNSRIALGGKEKEQWAHLVLSNFKKTRRHKKKMNLHKLVIRNLKILRSLLILQAL